VLKYFMSKSSEQSTCAFRDQVKKSYGSGKRFMHEKSYGQGSRKRAYHRD
jgi:hypothetical protein